MPVVDEEKFAIEGFVEEADFGGDGRGGASGAVEGDEFVLLGVGRDEGGEGGTREEGDVGAGVDQHRDVGDGEVESGGMDRDEGDGGGRVEARRIIAMHRRSPGLP